MNKLQDTTKVIIEHLKSGANSDWEAAEQLGFVVGTRDDRKGAEIVEDILKAMPLYSKDRIYRLARAGRAYILALHVDEELAQKCRTTLYIGHMEAVTSCVERKDCTWEEAMKFLRSAIKNDWSADVLRAKLPKNKKFAEGGWNDKAKKAIPVLRGLLDETLGAKDTKVMTGLRLVRLAADWLERMTE